MMLRLFAYLAALVLAPVAMAQAPLTPAQAIAAAQANPDGVDAVVEMTVASGGASGYDHYLNSEADYRDPANFSAEIHAAAANALRDKLGGHVEQVLEGKRVRLTGTIRRYKIERRDGADWYQTKIEIDDAAQLTVLD